jgi:hypothetical protein
MDEDLLILYHEAQGRVDDTKFKRNHDRLLRKYFLDLRLETRDDQQLSAVRYLRGPKQRKSLTNGIHRLVKPSAQEDVDKVNALSRQKVDKLSNLDRFLGNITTKTVADDLNAPDAGEMSDDGSSDDAEIEPFNLEHLDQVVEFLVKSRAFSNYKISLQRFIHPPSILSEALEWGDVRAFRKLLVNNFSDVATGEYEWLEELKQSGYPPEEIAQLLWDRTQDAPWIFFDD